MPEPGNDHRSDTPAWRVEIQEPLTPSQRVVAFLLGICGCAMCCIAALLGWVAFGWPDTLLVLAAAVGAFFWAFALGELRHNERRS